MTLRRLYISAIGGATVAAAAAQASMPVQEHSFGTIYEADGPVTTQFALVNDSDTDMRIINARANCGCTTPEFPRGAIAPADTAWIAVTYDPAGRPGRFQKRVVVDTDTEPRRYTFTISGSVVGSEETLRTRYPYELGPKMRLRDRFLIFGDLPDTETKSNYVEAYNCSTDTIRPRIGKVGPMLHVVAQPTVVPPGEQFIYSVVIRGDRNNHWGPQMSTFEVISPTGEKLPVEVNFNVSETFGHLSPQQLADAPRIAVPDSRIDLHRVLRGRPVEAIVTIENRGNSTLRLHRVYTPDAALKARLKKQTVAPGKSTTLTLSMDPKEAASRDIINIPLTIYSNDPSAPTFEMRFVGEMVN